MKRIAQTIRLRPEQTEIRHLDPPGEDATV